MTTLAFAATPSTQAITWLQQILHKRIHPDLSLKIQITGTHWGISCSGADGTITMPLLQALYQLGNNPELPCSSIAIADESFETIEAELPAPGCSKPHQPLVSRSEAGLHINYDILGLTYWMLARCEEVNPPAELLDNHQRFPATASHAFCHGYHERPIVDEWLGILRQLVQRLWPRLPLLQHQFRIVVSHDVDSPSAYAFSARKQFLRNLVGDVFKRRSPKNALNRTLVRIGNKRHLHPRDPFNTFGWLMDASEAAGVTSSFYFICGRTNTTFDAQYEAEDPAIRHLMRCIHKRGHEIGLHPSYETCFQPVQIASEAERLQRICQEEGIKQPLWGGRMHYLRWQWPTTAYGWEQARFHYDSTLSYADRPGFRCGTCHPYSMFDPVAQHALDLIQRPLIAMECSVIDPSYLGMGYTEASLSLFLRLKDQCKLVDGQFTLLWHNSHLTNTVDRVFYCHLLL